MGGVKKYNRQLSKDDAVWQYILDHAKKTDTGNYRIFFYIHNRHQWNRKIKQRMRGVYRNEEKDLESEYNGFKISYKKNMDALWYFKNYAEKMAKIYAKIESSGSLKDKIILWLYKKTKSYLRKKSVCLPSNTLG